MRVQWALLARYAEAAGGLVTVVGGGIDAVRPGSLPTVVQAFVAIQLRAQESEAGEEKTLALIARDVNLDVIGQPAELPLTIQRNPRHPPGWEIGHSLTGPFSFPVEAPGTYNINITIDGQLAWDIPIRVQDPPG